MRIYFYDKDGYLAGSKEAQLNPMSYMPGESSHLMPPSSTAIAPPQDNGDTVPQFNRASNSWSLVTPPAVKAAVDTARLSETNKYGVVLNHTDASGVVTPRPAGDVAAATRAAATVEMRNTRNRLLASTDYTQLVDAPLSPEAKLAWAAYRKQLRDLPANTPDPALVKYPKAPAK